MKKAFILFFVLVIIALIASIYFSNNSDKTLFPSKYRTPKTTNNELSEITASDKPNWSKLTNKQGKFQIEYPSILNVYEVAAIPWEKESIGYKGLDPGLLMLCVDKVKVADHHCQNGINIHYGLPILEWGGGCPDHIANIEMLNKTVEVCEPPSGLQTWEQIFHPNRTSEVNFQAFYSESFTPRLTRDILKTFSFTE